MKEPQLSSTRSLRSELNDRILRFDGVSEIEASQLARFLLLGVPAAKLRVDAEDDDIAEFNRQVPVEDQVSVVKPEPITLDMGWQIPEPYLSLDLEEYIWECARVHMPTDYTTAEQERAVLRIEAELKEVETRGMTQFFRTVVYILAKLHNEKVVWGVGRGSSCASYLLFLMGLHVVDCVKLEVPMEEFFHE